MRDGFAEEFPMRWLAFALLLLIFAVIACFPFSKTIGDGFIPYAVTIHSAAERPIKSLRAIVEQNAGMANQHLSVLPLPDLFAMANELQDAVQEPYTGEPMKVRVPFSETSYESLVSTRYVRGQFRGLLVIVEYANEKLEGRAVELPDVRASRSVLVEVP
jgi:hypothetical protein